MPVTDAPTTPGRHLRVHGVVQGVGFRPWVARLAKRLDLRGRVWNDGDGVQARATGSDDALDAFEAALRQPPMPGAEVRALRSAPAALGADELADGFCIIEPATPSVGARPTLSLAPDRAMCPSCRDEIDDPRDPRADYAFTSCTDCGPRYTVAAALPYARRRTSLAAFPLCPRCAAEYADADDRRFHAETTACPDCGPRLWLRRPDGSTIAGARLADAARALRDGQIVALKGLGGFHLACRADDEAVVAELRARKRRPRKPFAVMAPSLEAAAALIDLTPAAAALLSDDAAPIVIAPRRDGAPVAPSVAPGADELGVFLPYTPLHHVLLRAFGGPLVMTSGNLSEAPIEIDGDAAVERLRGVADLFVDHDRGVVARCEDSVVRVTGGEPIVLRRARGYVPLAIRLPVPTPVPLLAVGGHLANTLCVAIGDQAWLGPHLGDLEDADAVAAFEAHVAHLTGLVGVAPEVVVHDLHPDYASTRFARSLGQTGVRTIAVQHHHAHIAATLADRGHPGPALGLAFDGTGYGDDGAAWGGEILRADLLGYTRLATFRPLRLAGGAQAIREVWRIGLAALLDAFDGECGDARALLDAPRGRIDAVTGLLIRDVACTPAHGLGRWFDAAAALLLGVGRTTYSGEAAMALETAARRASPGAPLPFVLRPGDLLEIDLRPAVRAMIRRRLDGEPADALAAAFHQVVVRATATAVRALDADLPVALGGGCFVNAALRAGLRAELAPERPVLTPLAAPINDGAIALGQAAVAAARIGDCRA